MSHLRNIFGDPFTRLAGIVFGIIVALILFNSYSHTAETHPLICVFAYLFVPILVVVGGIVFILAIWRLRE